MVPLSLNANDHFWFMRPVDSSANSENLFYYTFGSNGPQDEWRVHHGVDMSNPVGEPIQAAADGTIVWAGPSVQSDAAAAMGIYLTYGNLVIIEHDFGYRGQHLWTLYAHMISVLVEEGQHVSAGEIIGLSGNTGDVSGPHVHMEVRMGQEDYYHVYNPLLWIAPYIGHGVVAGRVANADGTTVDDLIVTLTRRGRVIETTSTYVAPYAPDKRSWDVMSDPEWRENFVMGDIPEGTYDLSINIDGRIIRRSVTVRAGAVNFVDFSLEPAATPQPTGDES
jgi:murein DD-endopeptidase MepM/ murein hydrolase activator NlpD